MDAGTRPRWFLSLLLAVATSAGASPGPSPEPAVSERLRRVQERRAALERDLARLRAEERSLLGEVERLDLEVRLRGEELREAQILLQRTNDELDVTSHRLRQLEANVAAARPAIRSRARQLYKLGELSYLRLLLSVDQPSDMIRGYRYVTALARRDREQMAAFRADLLALGRTRVELEERTRQALAQRGRLDQTRRRLDSDRRHKEELLTHIVETKESYAAYVHELRDAEARLEQWIKGLAEAEVSVPITAFRGALPWPVQGPVRVPFGPRKHPKFDTYTVHNGIEIEASPDTQVHAVHEGSVVFADRFKGYGLMVVVDHGGKHHSLYARLGETRVRVGDSVHEGDVLGTVGPAEINAAGLYFEMRFQGQPEDPTVWLRSTP